MAVTMIIGIVVAIVYLVKTIKTKKATKKTNKTMLFKDFMKAVENTRKRKVQEAAPEAETV